MGRAYFPVSKSSEIGAQILYAASVLEGAANKYEVEVRTGEDGQFDNSASDGGAIALLRLAARIASEQVE